MPKTKVAICFSGELRTFKVAMPRIMKYFEGHSADIFCHTWTTSGDKTHTQEDYDQLSDIVNSSEHCLINLTAEKSIHHSGPFGNMLYSIQRANWYKRQHEIKNKFDYDLVIKCRYDMLVYPGHTFGPRQIENRVLYYSIGNRGLVHVDTGRHGLSDIIFWGDSPTMDIACDAYRYYNWQGFPRFLQINSGDAKDPEDSLLSPGTLIYQRTQRRNIKMQQVDPPLGETLWRTSVEHLNPDYDFEEIKRAY